MKIAFFIDSLPPSTDGVAHTYVHLLRTLQNRNIDFVIYSQFKPDSGYDWHLRVNKVFSFPFLLYSDYRIGIPYKRLVFRHLDRFKPDLIHASSPTLLGNLGSEYARKKNIPAVAGYHTDFVSYFKYYGFELAENLGWQFLRWFYNKFQKTYAPGMSTLLELEEKGFRNIHLWQRGIDLQRFNPVRRSEKFRRMIGSENLPVLLFVGRLVKEKDLADLVEMNDILKSNKEKFRLLIVGDGPMRPELKKRLPEAVFTGFLHGDDLSAAYASSDIFVFPSTTETFGNVILEANASGLPAVGVKKGGVQDLIIDGKTGYLAKPNQPRDLADKVMILLDNLKILEALRENALNHVKNFSWDAINGKLIESYRETIEHCRS